MFQGTRQTQLKQSPTESNLIITPFKERQTDQVNYLNVSNHASSENWRTTQEVPKGLKRKVLEYSDCGLDLNLSLKAAPNNGGFGEGPSEGNDAVSTLSLSLASSPPLKLGRLKEGDGHTTQYSRPTSTLDLTL